MNEPELIYIGPHDIEILWDTRRLLEENQQDRKDAYGWSDFDKMQICIDERCPQTRKREVLLHEIMHFVIWAFAVKMPMFQDGDDKKEGEEEEHFIQQFTGPMLLVMYQNHDLFQWMIERERNHG